MTWLSTSLSVRVAFVSFALIAIATGLAVHLHGGGLSPALRDILGDALWAAMLTAWIGALSPRAALWRRSAIALALCVAVELSQRIGTPALDALRRTRLGHLVLGSDYDPRDLGAYAAGVLAATLLEHTLRRHWRAKSQRAVS